MSDSEAIFAVLDGLSNELEKLEKEIEVLYKFTNLDEVGEKVSLIDFAKLNGLLAYAMNSLYYIYMKVNGISFEDHLINTEIDRVKKYMSKIQGEIHKETRKATVDVPAANRMIKSQLLENIEKRPEKMEEEIEQILQDNPAKSKLNEAQNPKKKLHKGSLMPNTKHLHWKTQLDNIMTDKK
eukprot:TRINITY_DN6192_c0_g1_i1.p1 TRINITY_DN6192_c0_g1~~TRINITY_DN6192_c0_g1_i1.p1  ORF type:complete len:182 (+),score=47.43 TRINITY_DN6192_c0_g1_i1:126-671(+)